LEYKKQIPFKQVYFTGIVRDKLGRKMSKSLGNSPDLLEMIEEQGADAVRFGVLISSPAGNDLLFDISSVEQGKMFCNKLWNALKLLQIFKQKQISKSTEDMDIFPSLYFEAKLNQVKKEIDEDIKEFKLSEALKKVYSLIWTDYCSDYLEWIKTPQDAPINKYNIEKANYFFEELMKLLHPFMPFITEEIYHHIQEREEGDDLIVNTLSIDETISTINIQKGEWLKNLITNVRDLKVKQGLKPKDEITLYLPAGYETDLKVITSVLQKQIFAKEILFTNTQVDKALSFVYDKFQCYITFEKEIDHSQQRELMQKDMDYLKGFLLSIEKKLGNEKFVQNAKPEIIENEVKKKNDALQKLKVIEESLNLL
jgi:valyl-tRNA synthetase